MKAERFTLDTNTPVYAVDCSAGLRQAVAREINRLAIRRDCWLTLQAVRAFYAVATRKMRRPMYDAAGQANDSPALFPALTYSSGAAQSALASAGRSVGVLGRAACGKAAEGGWVAVMSEDMADGTLLGGVEHHQSLWRARPDALGQGVAAGVIRTV